MGSPQNCCCIHKNRNLIISFLFLMLSTSNLVRLLAQGRPATRLLEAENKEMVKANHNGIGSRPPRCERRCSSCVKCEAIQVPVTTHFITASFVLSRGDDISDYKPISWKCKCGNLIFNP